MPTQTSTMTAPEILDTYFLETRAKLLEIAATLDRLHHAPNQNPSDPRLTFIQKSLTLLQSQPQSPNRTEQLLRLYSIE